MWNDAASQGCCMENLLDMQRSFVYLPWLCEYESSYIGNNFTVFSFTITCHAPLYMCPLFNPLNTELNPICHLLALLETRHILHVSRIRVNAMFLFSDPSLLITASNFTSKKYLLMNIPAHFCKLTYFNRAHLHYSPFSKNGSVPQISMYSNPMLWTDNFILCLLPATLFG